VIGLKIWVTFVKSANKMSKDIDYSLDGTAEIAKE